MHSLFFFELRFRSVAVGVEHFLLRIQMFEFLLLFLQLLLSRTLKESPLEKKKKQKDARREEEKSKKRLTQTIRAMTSTKKSKLKTTTTGMTHGSLSSSSTVFSALIISVVT